MASYVYRCPRCGQSIELMVKVVEIACNNKHKTAAMELEKKPRAR